MDRRVSDPLPGDVGHNAAAHDAASPEVSLSLRGRTCRDAYDLWRETVAPAFYTDLGAERGPADFVVDFRAFFFGRLGVCRTRTVAQTFLRDEATIARSGLDHFMVHFAVSGHSSVEIAGEVRWITPGDGWIYDMTRPLATQTSDFADLTLAIPRGLLAPLVRDVDGLHGRTFPAETPASRLLRAHLGALLAAAPRLTRTSCDRVGEQTARLVAAALEPSADTPEATENAVTAATRLRLQQEIERHIGDPGLGPDLLQRRFGLSRAAIYRLFEPLGGVSEHIRRRRLEHCLVDLARPANAGTRIGDLALKWGFGSEATFQQGFRRLFGVTPSDVRNGEALNGPDFFTLGPAARPHPNALRRWLEDMTRA